MQLARKHGAGGGRHTDAVEELKNALLQLDDPDDVFFGAKKYLHQKEQMKLSRTTSAMQLNQVPSQPRKGTILGPNYNNSIAE